MMIATAIVYTSPPTGYPAPSTCTQVLRFLPNNYNNGIGKLPGLVSSAIACNEGSQYYIFDTAVACAA